MTAPELTYPADEAGILGIRPRNDRVRSIMAGLAGARPVSFLDSVGVDPRPAPVAPDALAAAMHTAQKPAEGRIARAAKRAFLRGQYNWCYHRMPPDPPLVVACWNGLKGHRHLAMAAARARGHATLYLEEAPLPGRITVDQAGVNYGSSLPRVPAFYFRWMQGQQDRDPEAWREIRSDLKPRAAARRTDVSQRAASEDLSRRPYVFCPLQVPGDSQITAYGDWVRSVPEMIDHLVDAASALPEGWQLRVKEHPSANISLRGRLPERLDGKLVLDNSTDTMAQVDHSRAVVTINSSVGFESLFFDKPVVVLGHAFYGFPGVATKVHSPRELVRLFAAPDNLSFDAALRDAFMSYVTAVHFPHEGDVVSGRVTLEHIIARDRKRDALLREVSG